ncbi:hypothetical protein At1D132_49440 (plasmid) [Agrobacterium fabrum]|nr:hypothetical protein At1D132_49440 [Agrobacterium fabrum]
MRHSGAGSVVVSGYNEQDILNFVEQFKNQHVAP